MLSHRTTSHLWRHLFPFADLCARVMLGVNCWDFAVEWFVYAAEARNKYRALRKAAILPFEHLLVSQIPGHAGMHLDLGHTARSVG